jgi:hypothetical protein
MEVYRNRAVCGIDWKAGSGNAFGADLDDILSEASSCYGDRH